LGTSKTLETPHGKIKLNLEGPVSPGKILRIRGKGIPELNTRNYGDLLVHIKVHLPEKLSDDDRRYFQSKLEDANSVEFEPECKNPVIYLIDAFIDASGNKQIRTHKSPLGGTMRLGEYACDTKPGSLLRKAYGGAKTIYERHRHRYEANPAYRDAFEKSGLIISGESDGLIEAVEIKDHPWFLGVQFHPEFTSRLKKPNEAILGFVEAALQNKSEE